MSLRLSLLLVFLALHGLAIVATPEWLAPIIAGTVYGPLMFFQAFNLPVFGAAASAGWAAPSLLGWGILILVWAAIWLGVASLIACGLKKLARSE